MQIARVPPALLLDGPPGECLALVVGGGHEFHEPGRAEKDECRAPGDGPRVQPVRPVRALRAPRGADRGDGERGERTTAGTTEVDQERACEVPRRAGPDGHGCQGGQEAQQALRRDRQGTPALPHPVRHQMQDVRPEQGSHGCCRRAPPGVCRGDRGHAQRNESRRDRERGPERMPSDRHTGGPAVRLPHPCAGQLLSRTGHRLPLRSPQSALCADAGMLRASAWSRTVGLEGGAFAGARQKCRV